MWTFTTIVHRAGPARWGAVSTLKYLALGLGVGLLVLNATGWFLSLRSDGLESYVDFTGTRTLPYEQTLARLAALDPSNTAELVTKATRIFHEGMAHVRSEDVRAHGLDHYRMRVPPWENYLLYALSYLKPDTYRDYEFCSYHKALKRGTGRCGQQSLALVGFLAQHGLETGFITLGGHAVATAKVKDVGWYMLDPDYGGVMPFDLALAERNPERVTAHYWSDAARERQLHEVYGPKGNSIQYGGPEARYARACPIEKVAYFLKWALPVLLIVPFVVGLVWKKRIIESPVS